MSKSKSIIFKVQIHVHIHLKFWIQIQSKSKLNGLDLDLDRINPNPHISKFQGQELPKQTWGSVQQVSTSCEISSCWSEDMIVYATFLLIYHLP